MEFQARIDYLALTRLSDVGPVLMMRLLERFPDPSEIRHASLEQLKSVPGIGPRTSARIRGIHHEVNLSALEDEVLKLHTMGCGFVTLMDSSYPPLLRQIHDPPPVLYIKGEAATLNNLRMIGVVGSRKATQAGIAQAGRLTRELAAEGVTTVSGMALGVDTAAHWGSLNGGGPTVGVLATGLDVAYPRQNNTLKERTCAQGCMITEAPLGTKPNPRLFPPRNRIISGLCHGVIIVEAANRSGSLITARTAMEQNREVLAVPGPANDPRFSGVNNLLRYGAALVENTEDVLDAMSWKPLSNKVKPKKIRPKQPTQVHQFIEPSSVLDSEIKQTEKAPINTLKPLPSEGDAGKIIGELRGQSLPADTLARRCRLTVADLSRILLQLEMSGMVVRLPGNCYAIHSEHS
ncbi:MAG: DNA-protecting protein DprA [Magnetococcales bacterium]|nr:DNA-protecting protein DprA [Magnetococcales bacterium]